MSQIRRQSVTPLSETVQNRLKRVVRKASYSSRYHEFRLKGKHPLRLLGTPKDPWIGSVAAGSHLLANRFYCEGQLLRNPDQDQGAWPEGSIWQATALDQKWWEHLHSFSWLRDLNRTVDHKAARSRAMTLVRTWLKDYDQWHEMSWSADIVGRRIINWMAYAPLILDSNDLVYRSKLLNCLARQARHLYHSGDDQLRGLPRIQAISGMILAGLYIPYGEAWLKKGTSLLKDALKQEILVDGGASSRNPEDLYRMLRKLLMVRTSYKAMGHNIPDKLSETIDRMVPMLKSLLHGDGKLALFNGASEQNANDIAATFSFYEAYPGNRTEYDHILIGEESGFRRLQHGATTLIMDAGPPADSDVSQNGHAGTLSFEVSYGKQRIIVNCGCASSLPEVEDPDLYELSRATAAHSTLVLNDTNSSEVRKDGLIGRGPTLVTCQKTTENGHSLLEVSHDGYLEPFGFTHHRTIYLNNLGTDIRGEDILERKKPVSSSKRAKQTKFDIFFHLHPEISVTLQSAMDRLLLRLPNSEHKSNSGYWQFQCSGAKLMAEESLYLGEVTRLRNCRQIVLSGIAEDKITVIKWSLRRIEQTS